MLDKVKPSILSSRQKSLYEPTQDGLIYPTLPTFSNFKEERLHLKKRLVAACRAFALEGS
jgi:hypothetical protein